MFIAEIESLFLNTLRDLEARASSADAYLVLGISALIRKLLIDNSPLVDQVNRVHRVQVKYEITNCVPPLLARGNLMFWSIQDGLDPESAPPGIPRRQVGRDQLLSTVLSVVNGMTYTLRDLITFEANVMGGVHAGSAKEEEEKTLEAVNGVYLVGGQRASLGQLRSISRVVVRGLEPLRQAIRTANGA